MMLMLASAPAEAQRQADLKVTIISPLTNSVQQTMANIVYLVRIDNLGPSIIKPTDTIGIDLILDGDTIINGATNERPFWKYTNYSIAVGDFVIITRPIIFQDAFMGTTVSTCMYAYPIIISGDTVKDLDLSNNASCINLIFPLPTGIAPVDSREL